ncbi:MAG: hypothetical protein GYA02_06525 [Clostridiaceae bacterium]|nr:hypothetical protein [Clostridiaceae bacterium]
MKYTIEGFSQERLIELGLDAIDAHILRWFIDFRDTQKMKTVISNKKVWYWVNYSGIINDLPILKIDKRAIQRRFMKLVKANILLHYTHRVGGVYSCYKLKDDGNYSSLVENPSTKKQASNDPIGLKSTKGIGLESTNPKDLKVLTKDSSTIKLSSILNSLNNEQSIKSGKSAFCCTHFLGIYLEKYHFWKGEEHPSVTEEQATSALKAINESGVLTFGEEGARVMINDYFLTVKCDHNINHFVSGNIIRMRIERYRNDLCFKDASLRFQVECYRDTGRFDDEYLDFLNLYAEKYRQHTGEEHPAMKLNQLDDCRDSLASEDLIYSESMDDILDDFFMNAKQSDHRLPFFASEGVIEITNYRAM